MTFGHKEQVAAYRSPIEGGSERYGRRPLTAQPLGFTVPSGRLSTFPNHFFDLRSTTCDRLLHYDQPKVEVTGWRSDGRRPEERSHGGCQKVGPKVAKFLDR